MLFYNPTVARELWLDPELPATAAHQLLIQHYDGCQFYHFEPDTIVMDLADELHLEELPRTSRELIQAVCLVSVTDRAWRDWEVFTAVGQAFNHEPVWFETVAPLTPEALVWTLIDLQLQDGFDHRPGPEVLRYCRTVLRHHGLATTPRLVRNLLDYKIAEPHHAVVEAEHQAGIIDYCVEHLAKLCVVQHRLTDRPIWPELTAHLPQLGDLEPAVLTAMTALSN